MTDNVTELRRRYKVQCRVCHHFNSDMTVVHDLMEHAADEIQMLRAELARFDPVLTLAEGDELTLGDGFVAYRGPGTLYDVDEETP